MGVFTPRVAFKPFEYPEVLRYKDAINHSYWLVGEWNFLADVHDFRVKLTDVERSAVKRAMLAISQIEVSVKKFWAKLGERFPKPEFDQVGVTFAESEVRHADAYSHLLEVLGLNTDFDRLLQQPVIQGRVDYLTKYLKGASDNSNENYTLTLALFSIFVENVSLFSQFLVIQSFWKHRGVLKDVDNVVQATRKEEVVHALLGAYLIGLVKAESPEWFHDAFYAKVERACRKACDAEARIVEWIFEEGDLGFLDRATVMEYVRHRFNESMGMLGCKPVFAVDEGRLAPVRWFVEETAATVCTDFFHKKPVTYSKKVRSIRAEDLF